MHYVIFDGTKLIITYIILWQGIILCLSKIVKCVCLAKYF